VNQVQALLCKSMKKEAQATAVLSKDAYKYISSQHLGF
jgi:hypothetical protein